MNVIYRYVKTLKRTKTCVRIYFMNASQLRVISLLHLSTVVLLANDIIKRRSEKNENEKNINNSLATKSF